MKKAALFLATGAFSGFSPVAPGTAGSLLAACILFLISDFFSAAFLAATVVITLVGIWASAVAERYFNKTDASQIVIDEIAGMFIAVAFVPHSWQNIAVAFFLFRFYDILKPPPARQAEDAGTLLFKPGTKGHAYAGGLGIMLDDVVAGIYANITLQVLLLVLP